MIQRAYRFRLYPTASQRKQLAVEFSCARFVWNKALALRTDAYEQRKEHHNYVSLNRLVTEWKRTAFPWLAEATAGNLTQALIDQDKAFDHFFRRAKAGQKPGYPRFKSRYHRQSVRYPLDQRRMATTYQAGVFLKLPKLGAVKIRWSRVPTGTPKMATVSKDPCGRYFVSFACEEAIAALPLTGHAVGLALGIKHVVVASDCYQSGNPKHLKGMLRHLKRQQRRLSRQKKGSNRRNRQRVRVAKIHARIAAMRADFLHKTTTAIVRRADVIALEDLNVAGMLKNRHLSWAIADVGMGEFRRQIEYKSAWYGRRVVFADRWAPTSKTCSECGQVQDSMPLKVREWTCDCGAHHDRDVNAARNILQFAGVQESAKTYRRESRMAGTHARGGSTNLSGHVSGTPDEARTEADKSDAADRMDRARVIERRGFQNGPTRK